MRRSDIPSLDDLRAFATVARVGSVRGAADELALSHGAVSRRISKLSQDLGMELVRRDGRGIALTENGALLARSAQQALDIIAASLNDMRRDVIEAPMLLSCERSVAMRWLIPKFSGFQDSHPDAPVHLSVGGGPLDFAADGVTLAVRRLDFPVEPNWSVTVLFNESIGPVMTNALRSNFEGGDYIGLGSKTRPEAWQTWQSLEPNTPAPRDIRYFDHHFLMAEAAAAGLGVAMCPKVVALNDLATGRLQAPRGFHADGSSYGLIHLQDLPMSPLANDLIDWLGEATSELR